MSIRQLSIFVCILTIGACGATPGSSHGYDPCSEPWFSFVEANVQTSDGDGHGPDPGSLEWRSVVEFKLGIRGDAAIPPQATGRWCEYIDEYLDAELWR